MKHFLIGIATVDGLLLAFILGWIILKIISGVW